MKKEATNLLSSRVQFPKSLTDKLASSNGIIHKLSEKINMQIDDVTKSLQFTNWFGDWQNEPKKASKVVNDDGTPMVVYHGTKSGNIKTFRTTNGNGTCGLYLSINRSVAEAFAGNDREVYETYVNLAKYKGHLERIEEYKAEIADLEAKRQSTDKAHKNLFTSKITSLENRIAESEKWLSKLEEMPTIKRLVEKELKVRGDMAEKPADKGEETSYLFTPDENGVDTYTEEQYNSFGWASYIGSLTHSQINDLYSKIQEKRSLKFFPQSSNGEAIIAVNPHPESSLEVDNTLVFVKGTKQSFSITRVLVIDLYSETDIFELEEFIYEAEQKPWSRARGIVANMFESELVREFRRRDFASYQEYAAAAKQRSLGREGPTNNRNNQQQYGRANDIGESASDEIISYSYTPDKEATSTREILADMMETVAESESEQRLLAKYKGYLERIGNDKSEISRLREERKNASKAKKKVFTSKIEALDRDISDTERRLSKLEEMATIKRLVERERAKLADEALLARQMAQGRRDAKKIRKAEEDAQHVRDSRDKATEGMTVGKDARVPTF